VESKANYALVGAAVILIIVGFISAILWLSGVAGKRDTTTYTIYFRQHSLSGLQADSGVTMKGIKVGSVKSFKLSPVDTERVKVVVEVGSETPVKEDTEAIITRNLLTGLASIDLTGGTAASQFRVNTPLGEDSPIIPEGRTELDTIADSIPGLVEDLGSFVSEARHVFSEENRESLRNTLANIDKFTSGLAASEEDFQALVKNLKEITDHLGKVSVSLEKTLKGSDRKLQVALDNMAEALAGFNQTAQTVNAESKKLSKTFTSGIDVVVVDINNVTKDISRAARSVSAAMEKLDDPKSIIVGPNEKSLGPGESLSR